MALITKTTTLALLGCILICCTESTATAQDAESVFRHCVEHLDQINERTTNAQHETLLTCVPRIKRLIEAGEIEKARHAARRCIAKLDSLTEAGTIALHEACHRCVRALNELKAFRLAERLTRICREHVEQLKKQNRRAKKIIIELF